MQKIFRKWMIFIMSVVTLIILVINTWMKAKSLEKTQYDDYVNKLNQTIDIMGNNSVELKIIEDNLNEDYMVRCRAAAFYIEDLDSDFLHIQQLKELAQTINVDEIHVINEEGIIEFSSVEQYVDFNMYSGDQSRSFMELAEGKMEGESFIQETMPNSSEGVVMKYVGVICGDGKIVQVGFKPVREMEAKQRNTYEYIFQKFPTAQGGEYFAIDIETDTILGHSNTAVSGNAYAGHSYEKMRQCTEGKFMDMENGERKYVVTKEYGNVLLGIAGPAKEMYMAVFKSTLKTAILLVCSMFVVIFALNLLLKRIVVDGVHEILDDVSDITSGNLDTVVHVGGNPEFVELSGGINIMVDGLHYENNHDYLTGLCNYKYFKNISAAKLAKLKEGELFSVVMLDLDSFKQINDTYGHDIGDRYLREFAAALGRMPEDHCYVARRSGDEFSMCIFGYRKKAEIDGLVHELEHLVAQKTVRLPNEEKTVIGVSGGYVVTDNSSETLEALMKKADEKLYMIKKGGKGSIGEY